MAFDGHDAGRHEVAAALYDRTTLEAERHGAVLAMPETVALARPEGDGHPSTTIRIPIVGRADWLRLARSA